MNDLSPSDLSAIVGNSRDGDGLGGDNGILWLLLFILIGGFGNRGYGGAGAGGVGGNELYPWLNNAENINGGFRDQMIQTTLQGIQTQGQSLATQLCNCCGDMQMALANGFAGVNLGLSNGFAGVNQALCNGFNGTNMTLLEGFNNVEQGANQRQMANMQTQFGMQTAMMQGFTGSQAQTAQLASDVQLGMANQTATMLAEHCQDRAASAANTQRILDKLCDLELQGARQQLDDERRANAALQNQLNMANLAASQAAQNAFIQQGFANEVDALYNRLNTCPVPSMPVYGRTPIFTCQGQSPCGCMAA